MGLWGRIRRRSSGVLRNPVKSTNPRTNVPTNQPNNEPTNQRSIEPTNQPTLRNYVFLLNTTQTSFLLKLETPIEHFFLRQENLFNYVSS